MIYGLRIMRKVTYDKTKVGKFIGWGGEHLVFNYGEDKIIKFSLHVLIAGKTAVQKKVRDYEIGRKYFDPYLLPTEIIAWKDGRRAVEIQQKINCRFLKLADLDNSLIKKQFIDIMERCQRMAKEIGAPFDLLGREGLLAVDPDFLSNILVTPANRLVLIDFTILSLEQVKLREIFIWLIIKWAKRKQRRIMKKFNNAVIYVQN